VIQRHQCTRVYINSINCITCLWPRFEMIPLLNTVKPKLSTSRTLKSHRQPLVDRHYIKYYNFIFFFNWKGTCGSETYKAMCYILNIDIKSSFVLYYILYISSVKYSIIDLSLLLFKVNSSRLTSWCLSNMLLLRIAFSNAILENRTWHQL